MPGINWENLEFKAKEVIYIIGCVFLFGASYYGVKRDNSDLATKLNSVIEKQEKQYEKYETRDREIWKALGENASDIKQERFRNDIDESHREQVELNNLK
ncbi:hypothetical protein [Pedobacter cryophilus]|uniref:Uncharacterized protein n=1 Tax=Pedobacter cryophilus TaxID=2571271 RepID=A0A4U1BWG9_9SPHI|nr:hypothetical protein [Pedobacter cryophilus]TKB96842.1 hypothetical protein FA046_12240 [Pedobacter cryophilus]